MNRVLLETVLDDSVTSNFQNPQVLEQSEQKKIYFINVVRFVETSKSTISRFECEGSSLSGFFLEPAGPSTIEPNKDRRIPIGIYDLEWHSGKFVNVPLVSNNQVGKKRAILIHNGNFPTDTEGCLLIGKEMSSDFVGNSKPYLKLLQQYLSKMKIENVKIKINEKFT